MEKDTFKYEEAVRQLEDIVEKMESDELDVDSMSENLKKAQKLIKDLRESGQLDGISKTVRGGGRGSVDRHHWDAVLQK